MKSLRKLSLVNKVFLLSLLLLTLPTLVFAYYLYDKQTSQFYGQLLEERQSAIDQLTGNVRTKVTSASELSKDLSYRSPLIALLKRENLSQYPIWSNRYMDEIISSVKYSLKYQNLGIDAVRIYSLNPEIGKEITAGSYFYPAENLESLPFFENFLLDDKMVALYYLSNEEKDDYFSKQPNTTAHLKYNNGILLMLCKIIDSTGTDALGYMVFEMSPRTFFPELFERANENDDYFVWFKNIGNFYGAQPPEQLLRLLKNDTPESGFLTIDGQNYLCNAIDGLDILIVNAEPVHRTSLVHSAFNLSVVLIWLSLAQLFILTLFIKHAFARLHKDINQMDKIVAHEFKGRITIHKEDELGQIARRYNILLDRIDTLVDSLVQKETANTAAKLKSLQYQINPHFIYNTLNIFSGCAEQNGSYELSESIASFGHLLRYNLNNDSLYSTVEQELQNANALIGVYSIRYFNKLQLKIHADSGVRQLRIIKFILQPLLENSILHGLVAPHTSMLIQISIEVHQAFLTICVVDDGVGMTSSQILQVRKGVFDGESTEKPSGSGSFIGLRNIWDRLKLFYGNGASMEINSEEGGGTSVSIQIPLELTQEV